MLGAAGKLDALEQWVRSLTRREVFTLFDFTIARGGAYDARLRRNCQRGGSEHQFPSGSAHILHLDLLNTVYD
mgnify:CR=1 FL=1